MAKSQPAKLQLEKVLGLTAWHNAALAHNPVTGDVAYPAGCITVVYNPKRHKQVRFFKAKQPVTCVTYSDDGQFLALGERGKDPVIRVFELRTGQQVAELARHRYGVAAVAFSRDSKHLVSLGFSHDAGVHLWNWRTESLVATGKVSNKMSAVTFSSDNTKFITCGERHVRFWDVPAATDSTERDGIISLSSRLALLGKYANELFVDVAAGTGPNEGRTYAISASGMLCCFDKEQTLMLWVSTQVPAAFCLSQSSEDVVAVGGADGIVRLFKATDLQFLATLPQPPPVGAANSADESVLFQDNAVRPATLCVRVAADGTLIAIYGDRSLFVFNVHNLDRIATCSSYLFHSGPIWDVKFMPVSGDGDNVDDTSTPLPVCPAGTFVTCSSDSTVRFWNLDRLCTSRLAQPDEYSEPITAGGADGSKRKPPRVVIPQWRHLRNPYCRELLRVIYADTVDENEAGDNVASIRPVSPSRPEGPLSPPVLFERGSMPGKAVVCEHLDTESPPPIPSGNGLRTFSINPLGDQMAVGDRQGTLRIFNLRSMKRAGVILAHDSEIMTTNYMPSSGRLLVSGSRDRLVHVFDARNRYELLQTLELHSGSVTVARFSNDDSKLFSCGGDKSVVYCKVEMPDPDGNVAINRLRSVPTKLGSVLDMQVDAANRHLITVGQDKHLTSLNIATGKSVRRYSCGRAEVNRVAMDPAGLHVAVCSFDRVIQLMDVFVGTRLARVSAHSELVTGLAFSPDGRRLVSVGGDGCIMVWRLAADLTQAIMQRIEELGRNLMALPKSVLSTPIPAVPPQPPASATPAGSPAMSSAAATGASDSSAAWGPATPVPTSAGGAAAGAKAVRGSFDFEMRPSALPAWAQTKPVREHQPATLSQVSGPASIAHPDSRWAQRAFRVRDPDPSSSSADNTEADDDSHASGSHTGNDMDDVKFGDIEEDDTEDAASASAVPVDDGSNPTVPHPVAIDDPDEVLFMTLNPSQRRLSAASFTVSRSDAALVAALEAAKTLMAAEEAAAAAKAAGPELAAAVSGPAVGSETVLAPEDVLLTGEFGDFASNFEPLPSNNGLRASLSTTFRRALADLSPELRRIRESVAQSEADDRDTSEADVRASTSSTARERAAGVLSSAPAPPPAMVASTSLAAERKRLQLAKVNDEVSQVQRELKALNILSSVDLGTPPVVARPTLQETMAKDMQEIHESTAVLEELFASVKTSAASARPSAAASPAIAPRAASPIRVPPPTVITSAPGTPARVELEAEPATRVAKRVVAPPVLPPASPRQSLDAELGVSLQSGTPLALSVSGSMALPISPMQSAPEGAPAVVSTTVASATPTLATVRNTVTQLRSALSSSLALLRQLEAVEASPTPAADTKDALSELRTSLMDVSQALSSSNRVQVGPSPMAIGPSPSMMGPSPAGSGTAFGSRRVTVSATPMDTSLSLCFNAGSLDPSTPPERVDIDVRQLLDAYSVMLLNAVKQKSQQP